MRIHHFDATTLCPILGKTLNREGKMVCHCLLVESDQGLILVDTGVGLGDLADARHKLGFLFENVVRPGTDPENTAVRHIARLGFRPADVRHIVLTHLDLDHAGGIPDFPGALVHCHLPEHAAAFAPRTRVERSRYRRHQFEAARFALHAPDGQGERWFGFEAVKPLAGLDIALVPLVGHTRGHCGVAVRGEAGWLLHCGDAYFHADEMNIAAPRCTLGLRLFQRLMAMDNAARVANQARLRALAKAHGPDVRLFCAHDPSELTAFAAPDVDRAAA